MQLTVRVAARLEGGEEQQLRRAVDVVNDEIANAHHGLQLVGAVDCSLPSSSISACKSQIPLRLAGSELAPNIFGASSELVRSQL